MFKLGASRVCDPVCATWANEDVEGSAWRGRVLVSASLLQNVQKPKLLCRGQLPISSKRRSKAPPEVAWTLRVFVLEGNSLPMADSTHHQIELTIGDSSASPSASQCHQGRTCWFSELDVRPEPESERVDGGHHRRLRQHSSVAATR